MASINFVFCFSFKEPSPRLKDKSSINANQINLVKLLVGRGANVKVRDSIGNTPKDLAIQYDFYDCAETLTDLSSELIAFITTCTRVHVHGGSS